MGEQSEGPDYGLDGWQLLLWKIEVARTAPDDPGVFRRAADAVARLHPHLLGEPGAAATAVHALRQIEERVREHLDELDRLGVSYDGDGPGGKLAKEPGRRGPKYLIRSRVIAAAWEQIDRGGEDGWYAESTIQAVRDVLRGWAIALGAVELEEELTDTAIRKAIERYDKPEPDRR